MTSLISCQEAQASSQREVFEEFEKFLKQFNKTYTNMTEFTMKYTTFKKNFFIRENLIIQEKNTTNTDNTTDEESSFGDSPFMDIDPEEFQRGYLSLKKSDIPEATEKYFDNEPVDANEIEDDEEIEGLPSRKNITT